MLMEIYYLMTLKPKESLPKITHKEHNFEWYSHQTYPNVWVIKTIFTQNTMFRLVYGPFSLMSPNEDILLEKINGLNRVHPDSFGILN